MGWGGGSLIRDGVGDLSDMDTRVRPAMEVHGGRCVPGKGGGGFGWPSMSDRDFGWGGDGSGHGCNSAESAKQGATVKSRSSLGKVKVAAGKDRTLFE